MNAELFDTHCHLTDPALNGQLDEILKSARAHGVGRIMAVAWDRQSSADVVSLVHHAGVYAAVGAHPLYMRALPEGETELTRPHGERSTSVSWPSHRKASGEQEDLVWLDSLLSRPSVVALGEVGLDFTGPGVNRDQQQRQLKRQLALARDHDLPVILHCRKAAGILLELLASFVPGLRGVIHGFSRSVELARAFVRLGLHIGLAGTVTLTSARRAHSVARELPLERLLLETDAPCIGLSNVRAEDVRPQHVRDVAMAVARLRGESLERVAAVTTECAKQLFGLT